MPGGNSTSHGTQSNGPINSDGFCLVGGLFFSDGVEFPGEAFVWPDNTTIKYTEKQARALRGRRRGA